MSCLLITGRYTPDHLTIKCILSWMSVFLHDSDRYFLLAFGEFLGPLTVPKSICFLSWLLFSSAALRTSLAISGWPRSCCLKSAWKTPWALGFCPPNSERNYQAGHGAQCKHHQSPFLLNLGPVSQVSVLKDSSSNSVRTQKKSGSSRDCCHSGPSAVLPYPVTSKSNSRQV